MTEIKTKPNEQSVDAFLARLDDDTRRRDDQRIDQIMTKITGESPTMWAGSIVGYGTSHYRYATGREVEWFVIGFSPRKQNQSLDLVDGFDAYAPLLARLGEHTIGKSCLSIKQLSDVDQAVLIELCEQSVAHVRATNTP